MNAVSVRALGLVQCVNWGVLYYAFPVLLLPMAASFGAAPAAVTGAFSLGLALAALAAPVVGRALDRGRGVPLLRAGALATPALLLAWSAADGLPALYAVWAGLGLCMGLTLYEPAFALVSATIGEPQRRLRALATVTIAGGLASTAFVPAVGWSAGALGWRTTACLLALAWLAGAWLLERRVLTPIERDLRTRPVRAQAGVPVDGSLSTADRTTAIAHRDAGAGDKDRPERGGPATHGLATLALPYIGATFAGMVLATLAVPLLVGAGQRLEHAATVFAAFGLMQLPGRIWLARARSASAPVSPSALLVLPLALQITGLAVLALAAAMPMPLACATLGIALFGLGAGVHTIGRPWLVSALHAGRIGAANGRIAAGQGIARALGPLAAAASMSWLGTAETLLAAALLLALTSPFAVATARAMQAAQRLPRSPVPGAQHPAPIAAQPACCPSAAAN